MDQHRSFPRFSTSAGSQEGWHPARRSIVLLSQLPSRKLTSIHPQHCQRCGILDAHLCHHAGIGPPANAPPTGQRTNDRDLILTKVSVGRVVFASPHRVLVGWLSLTVLTNLGIHGRVISAWASGDAGPLWILVRATLSFSAHLSTPSAAESHWAGPVLEVEAWSQWLPHLLTLPWSLIPGLWFLVPGPCP